MTAKRAAQINNCAEAIKTARLADVHAEHLYYNLTRLALQLHNVGRPNTEAQASETLRHAMDLRHLSDSLTTTKSKLDEIIEEG